MGAERWICAACGTMYPASASAPGACPLCDDDRQYVPPSGQRWTTLGRMASEGFHNAYALLEPGLVAIETVPRFAIGQRALLLRTPEGNLLWDPVAFTDALTEEILRGLGGVRAICASHPHFFTSMPEWAERCGAAIYLHEANRPWVMHPHPAITRVRDDAVPLFGGLTLLRLGGHFEGSSVLHWPAGADGRGVLLTGDTIQLVADRRWVTFLHSYPNQVPLPAAAVARIRDGVAPLRFDRLYGGWGVMREGGREAVLRSAERYLRMVSPPGAAPVSRGGDA